jgi:hypothetical protein
MLNQPTIDKLCAMRMRGMAEALQQQMQEPDIHQLSFEERLGLLIDRQWDWRQNRALERRLRNARLQGPACVEDIDYRTPRGLDRAGWDISLWTASSSILTSTASRKRAAPKP